MKIQINNKDAPSLEFKDGRYYYTFTADKDTSTVDILSDCIGDTKLKRIMIEKNGTMTDYVNPEVYEGTLSGIFKDLREINLEMTDTENSALWGKIKINTRGMLEEYHKGTLSAEFMRTAGGIETRLKNELKGVENRYSETADGLRRSITSVDGRVSSTIQNLDGFKQTVENRISGLNSSITQLDNGIETRIKNSTTGEFSRINQELGRIVTRIQDGEGNYSSLSQTVKGLGTRIQNAEGSYSTLNQTVKGLQTTVSDNNTNLISRITQLSNGIEARIDDRTNSKFTSMRQTVDGLSTQVSDSNRNLNSRIDVLAGQINQKVTRGDVESIIGQSGDSIWLKIKDKVQSTANGAKMTGDEIKTAINLSTNGVSIQGKQVAITGDTFIQKGVINDGHISNLDASKITTGQLNAAIVRAINIDANQITSGTMSAIRINGGSLRALNGVTEFNLDTGALDFYTDNPAIRRIASGYPTQFVQFGFDDIYSNDGTQIVKVASTSIGSNRGQSGVTTNDGFVGLRIFNRYESPYVDRIQYVADIHEFTHTGNKNDFMNNIWMNIAAYEGHQTQFYPSYHTEKSTAVIGKPANPWTNGYFDEITLNNVSLKAIVNRIYGHLGWGKIV